MKKIISTLSLISVILINSPIAFAADSIPLRNTLAQKSGSDSATNIVKSDKVTDLKYRGDLEIQRRIEALNKLITRIISFKKLSDAQKADLTSQIQTQITNLNALKTKIDADTDITTLRTDVKSIVTDYRIFAFFIEYINLLGVSERMNTTVTNLTKVHDKLATRITQAQTDGQNVTTLNTQLTDMQTNITNAKTLIDTVNTEVSALNVAGYPGNKTTLLDARIKLKTAFADLKTAREDARKIIVALIQNAGGDENASSSAKSTNPANTLNPLKKDI